MSKKYNDALELVCTPYTDLDLLLDKYPAVQMEWHNSYDFKEYVKELRAYDEKYNISPVMALEEVIKKADQLEKDLDRLEKLEKAINILNRIYGFKLQDIKFSGFYELLIPDMTSDELTKEEYKLLKEVLNV